MNEREQAFVLQLLHRWRAFVASADVRGKDFAPTYRALCDETDDFLHMDGDPPRASPVATCGHCGNVQDAGKGPRCQRCRHLVPATTTPPQASART